MSESSKLGNYHHGDLRRAAIDTALAIIADRGIDSLTMREIANQIGVSRMAPYRHFENKAELLAVLAQEGFEAMYAATQLAAQTSTQPIEQIHAIGVAYIIYAIERPVHYRVMFDASLSNRTIYPPLYQAAVKNFDCLVEILIQGQQQGSIRAGDPKQLAQITWSLVHGLSLLSIDRQFATMGAAPISELANSAMTTLMPGLRHTEY
jgi:AcrR family transcriptional regulator